MHLQSQHLSRVIPFRLQLLVQDTPQDEKTTVQVGKPARRTLPPHPTLKGLSSLGDLMIIAEL